MAAAPTGEPWPRPRGRCAHQKLDQVLVSAEPRTLVLSESEAGFVLANLVGIDELPPRLRELRDGIEQ